MFLKNQTAEYYETRAQEAIQEALTFPTLYEEKMIFAIRLLNMAILRRKDQHESDVN